MAVDDSTLQMLSTTTLAIIAGGQGTRMGMPKALLEVDGRSMPAWLLDRLQWPGPTMLVTAPAIPRPSDAERFTLRVVDPIDGLGPLRGVLTALERMTTDLLVTIAVDMPYIDCSKLAWLVTILQQQPDRLGLMCSATVDDQSLIEPFPAAYRREARSTVEQRLASGRRSVHGLCIDDARFASIPAPPGWRDETWTNLNDRDEFASFQASRKVPDEEKRT